MSYSVYETYVDLIPIESFVAPMFLVLLGICFTMYLSQLNTDARLDQLETLLLELKDKELKMNFADAEVDTQDIPDAETLSEFADAQTETYTQDFADAEVQSDTPLDDAAVEAALETPIDKIRYVNPPLLDHVITEALSATSELSSFHLLRHVNKHLEVKVKRPQLTHRLEFMAALGYLSKSKNDQTTWSLKI